MKLKILIVILLMFMIIPLSVKGENTVIFEGTIDSIGGTRYENYLVYYPYNNSGRTGANVWGHEISVNEFNVVIEVNTNVTIVPGGYALSAHGSKVTQLLKVQVGDIVDLNLVSKSVQIIRDYVESSYYLANEYYLSANLALDNALRNHIDYNESLVTETKALLDQKMSEIDSLYQNDSISFEQENQIISLSKQIKDLVEKLIYYTAHSNSIEIRAMWHRPNATAIKENNLSGLIAFLDRVQELGFNTLYVETFWNGYVSYRSEIIATHPQVASFTYGEYGDDYITALISEAKKRNIDVHAWIHTFNAGGPTTISPAIKTEWLLEDYQGRTLHPNAYSGAYYLDPSNSEALEFIDKILIEMVTKYDFAGIQFDYIRYYDNNYKTNPIRDSGYGKHAETAFKTAYGLSGDVRTLILDADIRELWFEWRQNNITKAVKRFSELLRSYQKNIIISADVVGSINEAKNTYMQDWLQWVNNGYIDLLCPMIYTASAEQVDNLSSEIYESINNLSFLSSGIAPIYYGHPLMNQHEQMLAASNYGGSAIFASQNVIGLEEIENQIKNGVFRIEAVSLFSSTTELINKTFSSLEPILERITDDSIQTKLRQKMNAISTLRMANPGDYQIALNQLSKLIFLSFYIQNDIDEAQFSNSLERLYHAIDIKISRELIALGLYHPDEETRPDPLSLQYPDSPTNPEEPEEPEEPEDPSEPQEPSNPNNPEHPSNPENPEAPDKNNTLLWVGLSSGITTLLGSVLIILKISRKKVI